MIGRAQAARVAGQAGARGWIAVLAALVATLAVAPAQANVWLSDGQNPLNTRYSPRGPSASKGILPRQAWSDSFAGEASGTPIIAPNGAVYVGTTRGEVRAYVRTSGKLLWTSSAAGLKPAPILSSLLWADGMVWAVVSRPGAVTLAGLDPTTGLVLKSVVVDSQRNTVALGGPNYSAKYNTIYVTTCMCVAEEKFATTYNKGVLAAVDPALATIKWKINTSRSGGGGVAGSPLVFDALDRVYVGTGHSYAVDRQGLSRDPYTDALLAVDQLTGQIVGIFQAHRDDGGQNGKPDPRKGKGFSTSPNALNGPFGPAIGAGAGDGVYYAVDAATMTPLYQVVLGVGAPGGGISSAAFDGRDVLGLSSLPGLFWRIASKTGTLAAAAPTADPLSYGPISAGSKVVWWTTASGLLQAVDPRTGRPYGAAPLGAPSTAGVALGYGMAIAAVGTGEGTPGGIVAFR